MSSLFLSWSHAATSAGPRTMDRASYESARAGVVRYWSERLSEGTGIDVPEARVRNAAASLLIQNLGLGWRYSIGNPYQQFFVPGGARRRTGDGGVRLLDESRAILRRPCRRLAPISELEARAEARRGRRSLPALRRRKARG